MQPSWLIEENNRQQYQLLVGFVWFLIVQILWWTISEPLSPLIFSWIKETNLVLVTRSMLGIWGGTIIGTIAANEQIIPTESIKFSWEREAKVKLLEAVYKGVIAGLVVGIALGLVVGIALGLVVGIALGLVVGISLDWLIWGLKDEIRIREKPNQGIWESAKNTVNITTATFIMWIIIFLITSYRQESNIDILRLTLNALSIAILFSSGSGLSCIQHIVLRFFLWRNNSIPRWNYGRFLTYAADRGLLKQTGGSYRFYHDLLREHFAQMKE